MTDDARRLLLLVATHIAAALFGLTAAYALEGDVAGATRFAVVAVCGVGVAGCAVAALHLARPRTTAELIRD